MPADAGQAVGDATVEGVDSEALRVAAGRRYIGGLPPESLPLGYLQVRERGSHSDERLTTVELTELMLKLVCSCYLAGPG